MNFIEGVSYEECCKFVNSIISSINFRDSNSLSREDLLNIGLLTIYNSKNLYIKNGRACLSGCYLRVLRTLLREIIKSRYIVKIPMTVYENLITLKNKIAETNDLHSYLNGFTDADYKVNVTLRSYNDRRYKTNNTLKLDKLRDLFVFKIVDFDKSTETLESNESTASDLEADLIDYVNNLDTNQNAKDCFFYYFGIGVQQSSIKDIAIKYKLSRVAVYKKVQSVKSTLVKLNGWVFKNFSRNTYRTLRRKFR